MHAAKQHVERACAHRADVEFFIKAPGSEDVLGKITKTSAQGLNAIAAQMFTQADNFMAECTRAPMDKPLHSWRRQSAVGQVPFCRFCHIRAHYASPCARSPAWRHARPEDGFTRWNNCELLA